MPEEHRLFMLSIDIIAPLMLAVISGVETKATDGDAFRNSATFGTNSKKLTRYHIF
jgi:hypothetical protein